MGNFKIALEAATDHLRLVLPRYGFPSEPVLEKGSRFWRVWTRDSGWKQEIVEIAYRRGGESTIQVVFTVLLPIPDREEPVLFDAHGPLTPDIPNLEWKWLMTRHSRKVARSIDETLNWFEHFSTPDDCIAALELPIRNGSRAPEFLDRCRRYLESLPRGDGAT